MQQQHPNTTDIKHMAYACHPNAPVLLEIRPNVYRKCVARTMLAQKHGDDYTEHDGITDEDAVNMGQCIVIEQF